MSAVCDDYAECTLGSSVGIAVPRRNGGLVRRNAVEFYGIGDFGRTQHGVVADKIIASVKERDGFARNEQ